LAQGLAGAAGSTATEASAAKALGVPGASTGAGSQASMLAAENASLGLTPVQSAANISSSAGYAAGAAPASMGTQTANLMGAGIKNIATDPTVAGKAAYAAMPTGTVPALGLTAANAMTPAAPTMPGIPGTDEYDKQARVRLGSGFTGFVPQRPNPYYTPTGLGYAAGGEIQDYKFGGVLGKLLGEKRSGVHLPEDSELGYAQGGDIMLARGGDFDDQPGETAFMAAGGHLPRSSGADVGTYRDTDVDTASLSALDAAKKRLEKIGKASNVKMAGLPKTNVGRLGTVEMASGGLGGYSDGGRMLKGPGDGMSDSIPATIGRKQPARLADGEFVVPADVVSHLGNGSTDAGARKLYKMMDKVRMARTGKKKQAPAVKTDRYLPA
jgi:hypothetical protein